MDHANVGGSKSRLDDLYTTLIHMPPQQYEELAQDLGLFATTYDITREQAFLLKLEAGKQRLCK
jgi:hypothetical protein